MRRSGLMAWKVGVGVVVTFLLMTSEASANDPIGACCFPDGQCEVLQVTPCEFDGGSFIGEGTDCAQIDCGAPVAVPMLSITGLVALLGALAGLGIYGTVRHRLRRQTSSTAS